MSRHRDDAARAARLREALERIVNSMASADLEPNDPIMLGERALIDDDLERDLPAPRQVWRMVMPTPPRGDFIDRVSLGLPGASESSSLDGVYTGKSARISGLVRTAYRRGIRRGIGLAWDALYLRVAPRSGAKS